MILHDGMFGRRRHGGPVGGGQADARFVDPREEDVDGQLQEHRTWPAARRDAQGLGDVVRQALEVRDRR